MTHPTTTRNICILGNIGSGKTTLTRLLGSAIPNSIVVPEKFDRNPFLPLFLQDPARWAFTNGIRYYYDYARVYRESVAGHTPDFVFIDAGGVTNRHIYGRYLLRNKIMTGAENGFYNTLCELIQHDFGYPEPEGYIFLDSSPEACFERMTRRGWKYQTDNVRLNYLVSLHHYFTSFRRAMQKTGIPMLVLNREKMNFKSKAGKAEALARVREFLAR